MTSSANATFSRTVLFGSSRKSWKTVPIWRRSCGTFQLDRRAEVLARRRAPCRWLAPLLAQDQPQEGGLAGAGGADEEDELALLDLEGDIVRAPDGLLAGRSWRRCRIGSPSVGACLPSAGRPASGRSRRPCGRARVDRTSAPGRVRAHRPRLALRRARPKAPGGGAGARVECVRGSSAGPVSAGRRAAGASPDRRSRAIPAIRSRPGAPPAGRCPSRCGGGAAATVGFDRLTPSTVALGEVDEVVGATDAAGRRRLVGGSWSWRRAARGRRAAPWSSTVGPVVGTVVVLDVVRRVQDQATRGWRRRVHEVGTVVGARGRRRGAPAWCSTWCSRSAPSWCSTSCSRSAPSWCSTCVSGSRYLSSCSTCRCCECRAAVAGARRGARRSARRGLDVVEEVGDVVVLAGGAGGRRRGGRAGWSCSSSCRRRRRRRRAELPAAGIGVQGGHCGDSVSWVAA